MADVLIISYSQADSAVQYVQQLFEGFGDTVSHAVDTSFTPSIVQNYDLVIAMRLRGGSDTSANKMLEVLDYETPIIGGIYAYYGASKYSDNWESLSGLVSSVVNTGIVDTEMTVVKSIQSLPDLNQSVLLLNGNTYSDAYYNADPVGDIVGCHSAGASIVMYESGATLSNGRTLNNRVVLHGLLHNYETPTELANSLIQWLRGWVLGYATSTISGIVQKNFDTYDNCIIKFIRERDYKITNTITPTNGFYEVTVPTDETYTVICEDLDIDAPLSPLVGVGVKGEL